MDFRILIADSDAEVVSSLESVFKAKGYIVYTATNGQEAYKTATNELIHLIITEVNLPDLDGFTLCKTLRTEGFANPIIFLTNKESETYAIIGLEIGAQDYIRKPLKINEVIARVELQLKTHVAKEVNKKIKLKDLEVDIERRTVTYRGKVNELTPKEFQVLYKLVQSPKKVFSRKELLNGIWGINSLASTRTLDIHIGYLRKKIEEEPNRPKLFRTLRGVGYYLEVD